MNTAKAVTIAIGICLAVLVSGCGSSGNAPVAPLTIPSSTSLTLPSGEPNVAYNTTLTANGGLPPYAWVVTSGTLPAGLNLSPAGVLSGTPTASGAFSFSVSVTDSERPPSTANANLSLTIVPALQITTTSLSISSVGLFYSTTLAATGGFPAYTWSITQGSLPNGLTLNATSGLISGNPTGAGTSNFTAQVSDNGKPSALATASLSIAITPPPARNAALYVSGGSPSPWGQTGLQIQADGSLGLLPSSPESAINGSNFAPSPTLPLIFLVANNTLESLLVNPDYSLSQYSCCAPLPTDPIGSLSVDPTGSNLYLPGCLKPTDCLIDSSATTGINIFSGNGSLQPLGTIAIPNVTNNSQVVFTPDGKLAFIQTCTTSYPPQGSILSYSRASDGMLTATATYSLSNYCVFPVAVSSDGKYLAAAANGSDVQIYSIASNGTLTSVLPQPFTVTLGQSDFADIQDMTWDQSGAFLLVGVTGRDFVFAGGVGVLAFSGSSLSQTVDPTGGGTTRILRAGSLVYGMNTCGTGCNGHPSGILGFAFQNGQLTPLPGSPHGNGGDMVIY